MPVVYLLFQFQLNPGVLPFFPSQFLPKDTPCDMRQPFTDQFGTADEGLTDWNPLDYSPLWAQGPQSPFGHVSDTADAQHGSVTTNWSRMSAADSGQHDQHIINRPSEQVTCQYSVATVCCCGWYRRDNANFELTLSVMSLAKYPSVISITVVAFRALTLLVRHKGEHPTCTDFLMKC